MIRKINVSKAILILGLILTISVAVIPASATIYKATPANVNYLSLYGSWTFNRNLANNAGFLLLWTPGSLLQVTNQKPYPFGKIQAYEVGDYAKVPSYGECVDFAKAVSGYNTYTGNWYGGDQVIGGGVVPGTIIATCTNHKYDSANHHAAVFACYTYDSNWKINGFWVWDQNYVQPELVGKHVIAVTNKGGFGDAAHYYVINV